MPLMPLKTLCVTLVAFKNISVVLEVIIIAGEKKNRNFQY